MQGVVPAAGRGTRMGDLTADRPKGLVEVAGEPLLSHCFETLLDLGVARLVVIVGYRGDAIRRHYGNSYASTEITYIEQTEPRGLGDALRHATPAIDGDFVLLNGDNVCNANTVELVRRHRETGADGTMLVENVSRERARQGGVLAFDGAGEVAGVVEKPADPPSTTIPRGCYAFSERILSACAAIEPGSTGECELSDAIDRMLRDGARVETVRLEGWFVNVNTPADVERAKQRLASSVRD